MEFNYYRIAILGFFNKSFEIYKNEKKYLEAHKPSLFSWSYQFVDHIGMNTFKMQKEFILFSRKYTIEEANVVTGQIEKKAFSNLYHLYTEGCIFSLEKKLFSKEFFIYEGEEEIAKGSRHLFNKSSYYQMAVKQDFDHPYLVCLLITMYLVERDRRKG